MEESKNEETQTNESDYTVRELLDELIEDDSWGGSEVARKVTCEVLYTLLPTM